jgi:hexosaminidase
MKKILCFICIFAAVFIASNTVFAESPLVLLPAPRNMNVTQEFCELKPNRYIYLSGPNKKSLRQTGLIIQEALSCVGPRMELVMSEGTNKDSIAVTCFVNPNLISRQEGYRLKISPSQINIAAHDDAGVFYAAMTLRQICRQVPTGKLPCLQIDDWPDFAHRGIQLDVTRDKVPTMETLYKLVDMFASWKINQLQLYTEHAFAYRNHKTVWKDASPMTAKQIRELDAYCRQRFIELVPNQNSFAHMGRWLNYPRYKMLSEDPNASWHSTFNPVDKGPIKLLSELYKDLLGNFSSGQFNVGCDEAFIGNGLSRQACEERGVGRVYLDYLLNVYKLVKSNGKTMQFWADIILNHPELIKELPPDVIAMVWGYEAQHAYADQTKKMHDAGISFYVCPGTSSWMSILGRTDNAMENLRNAAENGCKNGAEGYLICDWGDCGHWQYQIVSYLPFSYGAALSWTSEQSKNIEVVKFLDKFIFQDQAGITAQLMYDLGNAYQKFAPKIPYHQSIIASLLVTPDANLAASPYSELTVEKLQSAIEYIDIVMARLPQTRMQCDDAELIKSEISNAAALLKHGCHYAIARLQAENYDFDKANREVKKQLAEEIGQIIPEYRKLWLKRNRPGGLDDSTSTMEGLKKRYNREN